jgi:hypothetical protein
MKTRLDIILETIDGLIVEGPNIKKHQADIYKRFHADRWKRMAKGVTGSPPPKDSEKKGK